MIFSMAAAGIASQHVGPRTIGLVAGASALLTAVVWAWADWSGRLPEPRSALLHTEERPPLDTAPKPHSIARDCAHL